MTAAAVIARPRLIERLEEERKRRITLLVAPAGYGKSTLLREFVSRPCAEPTASVRMRSGQRSPVGFVRAIGDALAPHFSLPPLHEYIYANGAEDHIGLRQWLLQALDGFSGTIAVDDLHVVTNDLECARFVAAVIDESPTTIRWIVSTRSVAGLPVASWRCRDDMGEPLGEAELGLTASESVMLSRACGVDLADQVIDHVAGLTRGWPAAFAFGINLAAKGVVAASVATYTGAFIDDLFAEQVLSVLGPDRRDLLLDTSLLTRVVPATIADRYDFDAEAMLRALRRDVAFVGLDASGAYIYHDLFRDFLRREVRKGSAESVLARVRFATALLVESDEPDAALDLCLDMETPAVAIELLERIGFLMIEGGYVDVAERAVRRLERLETEHAIVSGVAAMLESIRGNYVRAEELFARAIDEASPELEAELRIRLATHRLNRRDTAGAATAIAASELEPKRPELRLSLLTIRACVAARSGDVAGARPPLEAAVALLAALRDETHIAIAHHQIALVLYLLGNFERARSYATSAVQMAERRRVAGVAARARSVLSAVAGELGNAGVQRQINHDLRAMARSARDPKLLFFALANLFVIEIEAGHLAAARSVESELHKFDATLFRDSEEALSPAYALRAAWEGEFGVSLAYVRGSDAGLTPETRRLLRQCEIALYAVAAGETDEGRHLAAQASGTFERWGDEDRRSLHSRALTARILLALTRALLDEGLAARILLDGVRYANPVQRRSFDRFASAARAFVRARASGDDRLALPLARLRDSDLGGYALLIESLASVPALRAFADVPSALTPAERAVLERLSRGLSSKEIAAAFGKSRYTIDTQVKSIVRKFGCSGRGEAVYLARRYGMIE